MLLTIALTLVAVYLLLNLALAWISLHPVRTPIFISAAAFGVPQEEVEFTNPDKLKLRGWWLDNPSTRTVIVFAHGYVMSRAELAPIAAHLYKLGCSCLLFEFRASGRSEGRKSGLGWLERSDVRSAVDFARSRAPGAKIVLLGSSMGASACAFALGENPLLADALVLDSAYSKLSRAIPGWWRFVGGQALAWFLWPVTPVAAPMAGFNPYKVDVARSLSKLGGKPVLMLHGDADDMALPSEALRNRQACGAEIVWLPGCGHSEGRWVHPKLYLDALEDFLERNGLLGE